LLIEVVFPPFQGFQPFVTEVGEITILVTVHTSAQKRKTDPSVRHRSVSSKRTRDLKSDQDTRKRLFSFATTAITLHNKTEICNFAQGKKNNNLEALG